MPKINRPKRKTFLVRLTADERERLEAVQRYFKKGSMAEGMRAAVDFAHLSLVNGVRYYPDE